MNGVTVPCPVGLRGVAAFASGARRGRRCNRLGALRWSKWKGISGDARYFGRVSRETGQPSRRQVTLIEREQIAEHAVALGLPTIAPGAVRSNIETTGINLMALLGREIEIGEAVLRLYAAREPCAKMDAICEGLRARMMNERQGVLAEVVRSGRVRVGDSICPTGTAGTNGEHRVH